MKGPARKFTITNAEILRRKKAGESLRAIARQIGCSAMLLSTRLRKERRDVPTKI